MTRPAPTNSRSTTARAKHVKPKAYRAKSEEPVVLSLPPFVPGNALAWVEHAEAMIARYVQDELAAAAAQTTRAPSRVEAIAHVAELHAAVTRVHFVICALGDNVKPLVDDAPRRARANCLLGWVNVTLFEATEALEEDKKCWLAPVDEHLDELRSLMNAAEKESQRALATKPKWQNERRRGAEYLATGERALACALEARAWLERSAFTRPD